MAPHKNDILTCDPFTPTLSDRIISVAGLESIDTEVELGCPLTVPPVECDGQPITVEPRSAPFEHSALLSSQASVRGIGSGRSIEPTGAGERPAALQVSPSSINVDTSKAQPLRRETRKSMSRRSGQDSKPFKAGKWWPVRVRFDVPGVEKRQQRSFKVAPVSLRLSKPELERRAAEVIAASGANSEERFNRVVLGEGVTFREQAKIYLQEATTRNRRPIEDPTSIQGALRKWINPVTGDLPLSMVDNLSLKPLVKKMVAEGLSPRTCEKYTLYCKQVVASKKAPNGEDMYPHQWNAEVMDLPVVVHSKQKRPAQKVDSVNMLIASAESDEERYLYVLVAATGMRISEALALEAKHFINGGRTIVVEQQVMKDRPRIKKKLKTDASYRQIDLHPDVADYLRKFVIWKVWAYPAHEERHSLPV